MKQEEYNELKIWIRDADRQDTRNILPCFDNSHMKQQKNHWLNYEKNIGRLNPARNISTWNVLVNQSHKRRLKHEPTTTTQHSRRN